jgi:hypothetical protein
VSEPAVLDTPGPHFDEIMSTEVESIKIKLSSTFILLIFTTSQLFRPPIAICEIISNPFERDSLSAESCEHIFPRDRTCLSATPPPPPTPAKKRSIATAIKNMKIDDTSNGPKMAKKKPAMKDEAKGGELYTSKQPVKAKTKKKAANNDDGNERPKKKSRAGQSGAEWDAEEEASYWNDILNQFKPDWR